MATLLKDAGYDTAAFVGAFVLDHRFGLAQGFDTYDDQIPRDPNATERLEAERPASAVVDRALAWLDATAGSGTRSAKPSHQAPAPFFLWIHLYDPHAPYNPPKEFLPPGRVAVRRRDRVRRLAARARPRCAARAQSDRPHHRRRRRRSRRRARRSWRAHPRDAGVRLDAARAADHRGAGPAPPPPATNRSAWWISRRRSARGRHHAAG